MTLKITEAMEDERYSALYVKIEAVIAKVCAKNLLLIISVFNHIVFQQCGLHIAVCINALCIKIAIRFPSQLPPPSDEHKDRREERRVGDND